MVILSRKLVFHSKYISKQFIWRNSFAVFVFRLVNFKVFSRFKVSVAYWYFFVHYNCRSVQEKSNFINLRLYHRKWKLNIHSHETSYVILTCSIFCYLTIAYAVFLNSLNVRWCIIWTCHCLKYFLNHILSFFTLINSCNRK